MRKILYIVGIAFIFITEGFPQHVKIENGKFKLEDKDFYPLVVNYAAGFRKNASNEYWVTPTADYNNNLGKYECNDRRACLSEIEGHFKMIKEMGFNTIRICGLRPHYYKDEPQDQSDKIFMLSELENGDKIYEELNYSLRIKMFDLINDLVTIANQLDLKIILLTGKLDAAMYRDNYGEYLGQLANYFKNSSAFFAHDLYNEPTFESQMVKEGLSKSQICCIVSNWIKIIKDVADYQLVTIGYESSLTVFHWDPDSIPTDFASFHPYGPFNRQLEPSINQVGNEIYWYMDNLKNKPWIIGETGYVAHIDSAREQEQTKFADEITKRCINCGGKGFSWWQYQDVSWKSNDPDAELYGLLSNDGLYTLPDGTTIQGTPKELVNSVFVGFPHEIPTYECQQYNNYYNQEGNTQFKYSGKVTDDNGNPVNGAYLQIKEDVTYKILGSTYSKSDGSFDLYTNSYTGHVLICSYPGKELSTRYHINPSPGNSPVSISGTIAIGQEETYFDENNFVVKDFFIKGNGIEGGKVTISAPSSIKFSPYTKVDKGGILKVKIETKKLDITLFDLNCSCTRNSEVQQHEKSIEKNSISIFPNPTNGIITVSIQNIDHVKLKVFNSIGVLLKEFETINQISTIDISDFSSGIYILQIETSSLVDTKKIILNK